MKISKVKRDDIKFVIKDFISEKLESIVDELNSNESCEEIIDKVDDLTDEEIENMYSDWDKEINDSHYLSEKQQRNKYIEVLTDMIMKRFEEE